MDVAEITKLSAFLPARRDENIIQATYGTPRYYYCVIKRREDSKDSGAEIERGG
jgi:hypothetical protein